jgi:hypothetical protein
VIGAAAAVCAHACRSGGVKESDPLELVHDGAVNGQLHGGRGGGDEVATLQGQAQPRSERSSSLLSAPQRHLGQAQMAPGELGVREAAAQEARARREP